MKTERLIGSPIVRAATVALAALALVGGLITRFAPADGHRWLLTATIACSVLALIGAIHCSQALYAAWMRLAKVMNQIVTTLLFGVVYLLVVPPFALVMRLLDPLRLRRNPDSVSLWRERQQQTASLETLRRMG
jgi:hypothetical protein